MLNQDLRIGRRPFCFEFRDARRIESQSGVQVAFLVLQHGSWSQQQQEAEQLRALDGQEQKMMTKTTQNTVKCYTNACSLSNVGFSGCV